MRGSGRRKRNREQEETPEGGDPFLPAVEELEEDFEALRLELSDVGRRGLDESRNGFRFSATRGSARLRSERLVVGRKGRSGSDR